MTFADMLQARRSVRNYREEPVPLALIHDMIRESTLAPSAGNEQPWQFIIVNNKNMIKRMSDESKQHILACIAANPHDYASKYKGMLEKEAYNVFYNAPCLVLIGGPSDVKNIFVDCALAACYFMMAAASHNLGTCWVNLGAEIHTPDLRQTLGIPDNYRIVAPIIIGYPVKIPSMPERREPDILKVIT